MSDLRVYEAARKLNMQAGELVKILEAKGIHTSPISTIEESVFNQLLEEMVSQEPKPAGGEPAPPLKLVSFKEKTEPKPEQATEAPGESARPALALAPDLTGKKDHVAGISPSAQTTAPAPEAETSTEPKPASQPAAMTATKREERFGPAVLTAMLLVLLVAMGMGYVAWSVNNQSARIETAIASLQGVDQKIALAEKAIDLQGKQIAHNEASLAGLAEKVGSAARNDAKSDLATSSTALEEMSSTLPSGQAERTRDLARQMDALADSL